MSSAFNKPASLRADVQGKRLEEQLGPGAVGIVPALPRPEVRAERAGLEQRARRHAPLLTLLLTLGVAPAEARVRLGELLPAHPWVSAEREVVVVYSHDCGDLGPLWKAILDSGLPMRAVNAEDVPTPAPPGINVWRGPQATAFARTLRVGAYPTVLLVHEGRILNAWEGTFTGKLE